MSSATRSSPDYSLSWTSRYRWNVLDLLEVFGRRARDSYVFAEIDLTWLKERMERLAGEGHDVTMTSFLLKAIGIAQRNCPASRSANLFGTLAVTFERIVAGFTVERFVDDQSVVFFGEIEAPDEKSIEQIAAELKAYADHDLEDHPDLALQMKFAHMPWLFRKGLFWLSLFMPSVRLKCQKSTFGLSSLGAFGAAEVWGPPATTSVFGIGAMEDRAVVKDDSVVVMPMMTVTLSYDQRVMDVYDAGRLLRKVEDLIEGELEEYMEK